MIISQNSEEVAMITAVHRRPRAAHGSDNQYYVQPLKRRGEHVFENVYKM